MKWIRCLLIICLSFLVLDWVEAGTHSLNLRYRSVKAFPSLQANIGSTLAIAPYKDERPETLYIGLHTNFQGDFSYFKSHPFPLEKAIQESLSEGLARYGVKTTPISHWNGKPESLKDIETDSIMMIEIKRFWTEGKASLFRTQVKTAVKFVIHLGVKKEGKVFTRNVEMEREMQVARSTPERVEAMINQMLTDIFDSYFSNPY